MLQQDSKTPDDLWTCLAEYAPPPAGEMLAIAHNGKLANGRMFSFAAYGGSSITA
jgi:hypothetical protein